jgi:hypothetical protein
LDSRNIRDALHIKEGWLTVAGVLSTTSESMLAHTSYKLIRSILRDHEIATKVFDKLAKRYLQLQMSMSFDFVMLITEGGLSALHIILHIVRGFSYDTIKTELGIRNTANTSGPGPLCI